ncbi:hypothetical protein AAC387_Pa02g4920 [Persea americana]
MRRRIRRQFTDSKVLFDGKKFCSPKDAEEDPDEEDAVIYKGQRRRFDFQERPYEASPRATLMSPRSDWAAAEEMTRGTSSAFPEGY